MENKENQDNSEPLENKPTHQETNGQSGDQVIKVSGMYKEWFLDYASYVILERAVPHIDDGLKPVQRRILHSMYEMEDGRFHKVANIIGNTMKLHPHGDASIGDALVQLGQKELLIETQGNWGNIFTGDSAAAPRYIEARLSKFALEVLFSPKVTQWQLSYDGRNKEPVTLPVKFPLLLALGTEGIAVGMACKILPHNFNELIDASIAYLRKKPFQLYPDFPTGGYMDVSNYNDGLRGGKILVRAKISKIDNKTLLIEDIPYGTTTGSLIDSILKANDKGKIKVKKIEDNTAEKVEIIIHLAPGVSPDKTIDALYAFTDCQVSISPNIAVIKDDKPMFLGVSDLLRYSTDNTLKILKEELSIKLLELKEQLHFLSLEKIFIEKRIYRNIEECETWEEIISTIRKGLEPYLHLFYRDVTQEDIERLTEIKIKRISKYDAGLAEENMSKLESQIKETQHHIDNIVDFTIDYFKELKRKYGKGKERKTEIRLFDTIEATKVVVKNEKLYVNFSEGFLGYAMKNEGEYVCDCSDIDDIIVFFKNGTMKVVKIAPKLFVGKNIIYAGVWKKGDKRTTYNYIYTNLDNGKTYVKRFQVPAVTRDKEYNLAGNASKAFVHYLTVNPNGEAEVVTVVHKNKPGLRKIKFDYDFSTLDIKSRDARGNQLTKHPVLKVVQKEKGVSTLEARKIWFDDAIMRLNVDQRGSFLGEFAGDDKIISVYASGYYLITGYDLSLHFEDDLILIEKFIPKKPLTVIYKDKKSGDFYVKRFVPELSKNKVYFLSENNDQQLEAISYDYAPVMKIKFKNSKEENWTEEIWDVDQKTEIRSIKAKGNKFKWYALQNIEWLEPRLKEPPLDQLESPSGDEITRLYQITEDELKEDNPQEDIEKINWDNWSSGQQGTLNFDE